MVATSAGADVTARRSASSTPMRTVSWAYSRRNAVNSMGPSIGNEHESTMNAGAGLTGGVRGADVGGRRIDLCGS